MKIFQSIQNYFNESGIYHLQAFSSNPSKFKVSLKSAVILFTLASYTILSAMFLLVDKSSFGEYCESIYMTDTTLVSLIVFMEFVRNSTKIFELINNFENTIQKRKAI